MNYSDNWQANHPAKTRANPPASYLVHGGEELQTSEIISELRDRAEKAGYTRYVALELTTQLASTDILEQFQNLDLFSDKILLELRLNSDTNNKITECLNKTLEYQPEHVAIIIRAAKLKAKDFKTTWYQRLAQAKAIKVAKQLEGDAWRQWVHKRLDELGLDYEPEVASYLATAFEGNTLACMQVIQNLKLCAKAITVATLSEQIAAKQQYSVFDLATAARAKNIQRTYQVLRALQQTNTEPLLAAWALQQEIKKIPEQNAKHQQLTKFASRIDMIAKGLAPGIVWQVLESAFLSLASKEEIII